MDIHETVHYPHSEMNTFLLPATRGCSWNKCVYCSMYKDSDYKLVAFDEMKMNLMNGNPYTERVFLTGADPLSMGFDRMMQILELIKGYFKYCAIVGAYASIKNITMYSDKELEELHRNGLNLLYIGFESGRDDILKLMKKGHTAIQAIEQAKRLNDAFIQFNTIIMYGIGGIGEGISNAEETAKLIGQFETKGIITMNMTVFEGTELSRLIKEGNFVEASRTEKLLELRRILELLEPQKRTEFDTTHPTNILRIRGFLPKDKSRLLRDINSLL